MIQFKLQRVLGDWSTVTFAPDEIEYAIATEDESFVGGMYRLQAMVSLYECTTHQIPSAEHPSTTMHTIESMDGDVVFSAAEIEIRASYDELRKAMLPFLRDLFNALDEDTPSEEKRDGAFRRISTFCLADEFEEIYGEVLQE